ncbi:hypothetical protein F5Y12DRAFT_266322 [Xylaria sp. FL1777]|nr:hypothetical protein F5Y12DRAFT_266322 [Xylaria sp. FL1777]
MDCCSQAAFLAQSHAQRRCRCILAASIHTAVLLRITADTGIHLRLAGCSPTSPPLFALFCSYYGTLVYMVYMLCAAKSNPSTNLAILGLYYVLLLLLL